jgi:hypothetical protein
MTIDDDDYDPRFDLPIDSIRRLVRLVDARRDNSDVERAIRRLHREAERYEAAHDPDSSYVFTCWAEELERDLGQAQHDVQIVRDWLDAYDARVREYIEELHRFSQQTPKQYR